MKKMFISLILGVFFLISCADGTQAKVKSSCNSSDRKGSCNLALISLDGPYRHEINNEKFWPGANSVEVTIQVEVQKGTALVWMEDPQGGRIEMTVEPGQAGEIQGKAWLHVLGDKRRFFIYVEPAGEVSLIEDLTATIQYDLP